MSYEYSGTDKRLELPNPYKVENAALILSGAGAVVVGLLLLVQFRGALETGQSQGAWLLAPSLLLLLLGLGLIGVAMTQLRFYFGRNRPSGLAQDLNATDRKAGTEYDAGFLKETLRQNGLTYAEPEGPVDGLLYSLVRNLIYAPIPIRRTAQAQWKNFLVTGAVTVGLLIALLTSASPAARSLTAAIFAVVLLIYLPPGIIRGVKKAEPSPAGIWFIVIIILLAVLVPIIPALMMAGGVAGPGLDGLDLVEVLLIALVLLLIAQGTFFLALMRQLPQPPATSSAWAQRTLNLNASPIKLLEEIERLQQTLWVEQIPNRRYQMTTAEQALIRPGIVEADVMEETQPMPVARDDDMSLAAQLRAPRNRPLLALTGLALLCHFGALILTYELAMSPASGNYAWWGLAVLSFLVGLYCFSSGNLLWGRFDFSSRLVWIELKGSYEKARMGFGGELSAGLITRTETDRVEQMTLRAWVAELDTVTFRKDASRHLVAMRGHPDYVRYYLDTLTQFAGTIASVAAPGGSEDAARLGRLQATQQSIASTSMPQIEAVSAAPLPRPVADAHVTRLRCANPQCREPVEADARFCIHCGTPVVST